MVELSLHLLDIVENSLEAGATRVEISLRETEEWLALEIKDNGRGMDARTAGCVFDPFFTTRRTRRIGLGLPMLKQAAELTGGTVEIKSKPGEGTVVYVRFNKQSIDCMPLGDVAATLQVILACNPELELLYEHELNGKTFKLDTREIRRILGEVPVNAPGVLKWIKQYVESGLEELRGGVNYEDHRGPEAG
ncbi:MAG TPA: ATP-binding protein [Firmicutes bacterium]|nr:ATP-binding protein [Bacillota bacterium]